MGGWSISGRSCLNGGYPYTATLELVELTLNRNGKIPRIVTTSWIDESIKARTLLEEERFVPVPVEVADE